jgi:serine/threonine protein kinase
MSQSFYGHSSKGNYAVGSLFADKFKVLAYIGEGGMGVVYKVENVYTGGLPLAIKMMLKAQDDALVRLQKEAQALSRVKHKNIVQVRDFHYKPGQDDPPPYLLMEFVEGISLAALITERGRLSIDLTLEIAMQLCDGLDEAHSNSILHRDLKPQNIMITCADPKAPDLGGSFIVKILDFGIAKIFDAPTFTKTGDLFGSPPYMSPEQCKGEQVDARSDIYALGCVIYECLTSMPPLIRADSNATMFAQVNDQPLPLKEGSLGLTFSDNIEKFVARLLEKDPQRRHHTMMEVKLDLENLQEGKPPIAATQAASDKSDTAPSKYNKDTLKLITAVCLIVAIPVVLIVSLVLTKTDVPKPVKPTSDLMSAGIAPTPGMDSNGDKSLKVQVDNKLVSDPLKLAGQDLSDKGLRYLLENYKNQIYSIDVSKTEITDQGMTYLAHILGLKILRLDCVAISDAGIANLVSYRDEKGKEKPTPAQDSLLALMLEHDNVSNPSITSLAKLHRLVVLDLNHTLIDDNGLNALTKEIPGLKELDLSHDNVSDKGLIDCTKLKWLMALDVSKTLITDIGISRLRLNKDLSVLNVSETQVTDDGLIQFVSQFSEFSALYLAHDQISDKAMSAIARIKKLQFLDLNHTEITDAGLMRLASITSLKEISLDGSKVTAGGIAKFKRLCPRARVVGTASLLHYLIPVDGSYQYNLF